MNLCSEMAKLENFQGSLYTDIHDSTFSSKIILGKTCELLDVDQIIFKTNWKTG